MFAHVSFLQECQEGGRKRTACSWAVVVAVPVGLWAQVLWGLGSVTHKLDVAAPTRDDLSFPELYAVV